MRRSTARHTRLAVAFFVLLLVLVACGANSAAVGDELLGGEGAGDQAGAPRDGGAEPAASAASGIIGYDEDGTPQWGAPIEQRIVKTGEITLEVEQVGAAIGRVRAMVQELGGYVGGSQAGTLDDRASLTVRIPADRFDDALASLHELDAEVVAETTREQDVTGQVVDLAARIDNLRASEASYRELVARAERVEDILAVQSRLDDVRGQIEQLQAQLDTVEGQAALSTLTITLVPRATPITQTTDAWDPAGQLDRALASLVGIGQGLLDGVIWFTIVWLPILLVLALVVLLALRGVLEVRRRLPISGQAARAAEDDATA
jgi:hypothetical protein